jgi:hypothetical protein
VKHFNWHAYLVSSFQTEVVTRNSIEIENVVGADTLVCLAERDRKHVHDTRTDHPVCCSWSTDQLLQSADKARAAP